MVGNRQAGVWVKIRRGAGLMVLCLCLTAPQVWAEELVDLPEVDLAGEHDSVRETIREAEDALAEAREAGADDRRLSQRYGHLGRAYHAHGYKDAARAAYGNASSLVPDEPEWHYLLGMVAKAEGDQEAAIEHFSKVMDLSPYFVPAFVRRGQIFRVQGEWEEARRDFDEALDIDPESVAAKAGMGRVMLALDEHEEAVDYLESALEANPNATRLYQALAMAYRDLGERDKARAHLEKRGKGEATLTDPVMGRVMSQSRSPQYFFERGVALAADGRFDEAEPMLERATSLDPDSAAYARRYGEILLETENLEAARSELERARELESDELEVHVLLGRLAQAEGDDAAAMEAYEQALSVDPDDRASREQLAMLQMANDRVESAAQNFERLAGQADNPEQEAVFRLRLAMSHIARDNCRRAAGTLEGIKSELELLYAPALVELSRLRATCLDADSEALSQARAWLQRIASEADMLEVRETLAMVHAAMGNYGEAADIQTGVLFEAARQGLHDDLPDLRRNLERYEEGKPADRPYAPDSWRVLNLGRRR